MAKVLIKLHETRIFHQGKLMEFHGFHYILYLRVSIEGGGAHAVGNSLLNMPG